MTQLTCFANGKVSNRALNLLANTAGMVGAALTLTTTVALIAPAARADYLYSDPFSHDIWDRPTYNNGGYTRLDDDDFNSSPLYEDTLQDRNGNLYDCNILGNCHSRW